MPARAEPVVRHHGGPNMAHKRKHHGSKAPAVATPPPAPRLDEEYADLAKRFPVDAPGAVEEYKFFRERAQLHNDARLVAVCSIDLGAAFNASGDAASARVEFQRVVAYGAAAGDDLLVGIAKDSLGALSQYEGNVEDALKLHLEALPALRRSKKPLPLSRCLNNLALIRVREENFSEAVEYYLEARDLRKDAGDRPGLARLEANVGVALLLLGKRQDAERHLRAALEVMNELRAAFSGGGLDVVGTVCANLAVCLEGARSPEEAIGAGRRAAQIFEERGNGAALVEALHNLGCIYLNAGDAASAVREFNLAAEKAAAAGDRPGAARAIFNIAVAHAVGGNADIAKKACLAAKAEMEHVGDAEGLVRANELVLSLAEEAGEEQRAKIPGLLFGVRARRSFQAARLTG